VWKCKMKRKGARRVKGVLHAFPTSVCFHPRGSSASSIVRRYLAPRGSTLQLTLATSDSHRPGRRG
jgi:hypothetical protein